MGLQQVFCYREGGEAAHVTGGSCEDQHLSLLLPEGSQGMLACIGGWDECRGRMFGREGLNDPLDVGA